MLSPIWPDLIAHPMLARTSIAALSGGLFPLPKAAALLFWRRRQGLNLHLPPGAVLYRLSYVCVCPRWDTSLRGARDPVPHERCDLSALIVGCIVRAACCGGGAKRCKAPRPAMAQEVNAINERTAKAFTPLRFNFPITEIP